MPRKRLTRNAYKRKIILFGLLLFLAIGLISTGFASWMMSSSAKSESEGNVNVGVVQQANLEFDKIELYKLAEVYDAETFEYNSVETLVASLENDLEGFYFSFEPHLYDVTGRVHYGETEYGPESMTMIIKGEIGPVEVLSDVTITLELPESIQKAVDRGYIDLPSCATRAAVLTLGHGLEIMESDETKVEFTYEIKFTWGSAFGFMNPGLYYDQDPAGMNISTDQIQRDLLFLRACVYGYDVQLEQIYTDFENGVINEAEFTNLINGLQSDDTIAAPKYKLTIFGNIK